MRKNNVVLRMEAEKIKYEENCPIHATMTCMTHSPVHFHASDVEIVYCLKGNVNILCNHEKVLLKEDEVFTMDYRDIHCIFSDVDNLLLIIHIDMKNLSSPWEYLEYVYFACEDVFCQPYQAEALQSIKDMILAVGYSYMNDRVKDSAEYHKMADKIIDVLLGYFDWYNYVNIYPNKNEEIRERMQSIIKYCQINYKNKITIGQLAKDIHINENYFSQFMRRSYYGSFRNMLGFIRGFEAQYLLLTTDMPVITISHTCGFSDDKYFYKHFRYWWGQTPHQYRNWFREYIKCEDNREDISPSEGYRLLQPYIADYHVKNSF